MNKLIFAATIVAVSTAAGAELDASRSLPLKSLTPFMSPDRNQELALARSAAPPSISGDATIMVLTAKGYETAAEGKNGFTCVVERAWMAPFDSPDFMDPQVRSPVCFNAAASHAEIAYLNNRTRALLAGRSKEQMRDEIKKQVANHELPIPEIGAMSYMMSKEQNLGQGGHWHPHVMFHIPIIDQASWGANLPGSAIIADPAQKVGPEPETTFFVWVDHWSDGSKPDHDH